MPSTPTKNKPPEYLMFLCPLTVEAANDAEKNSGGTPAFHMVAYTGGVMRIVGFPHPVVVDLEGLSIDRQDIPVRLDHNPRQGVGHTQRVVIENGEVIAEGLVSRDTSWARDVAKSAANGFPWQASIGAAVIDAEFIPNGQNVTVNGRTFDGPLHVIRKALLKEISFVDSGADTKTSAKIAAHTTNTPNQERRAMPQAPQTTDIQDTQTQDAPKQDVTPDHDTPSPTAATPTAPQTVNAAATDDNPTDAGDPIAQMRQQMAAETRRVEAIHKICAGKHPKIEAQAIEEGWGESKTELQVLRASRPQLSVQTSTSRSRNDNPQVFEAGR